MLSGVHRVRVMSWILWALVNSRRHPGKVRFLVLPRCCCSSNRPKRRFRNVAMTYAPVRPLIFEASRPSFTSRR